MRLSRLLHEGTWTTPPVSAVVVEEELHVAAAEGSDAWRHTSYGFVHDTEHALLEPLPASGALEVDLVLDFAEQFDQAGLFLRVSPEEWVKAGVEVSDGVAQLGAVVTHGTSDWSVAPVPEWVGRRVTVRASRSGDAVTVRARVDGEAFRLVRVAHLDPGAVVTAGLFCAAPTRTGLTVRFTGYRRTDADAALH
ncbi:hypothetical protein SAMN05216184_11652 [Georgenia satyanarayanai]|uniref:DUF1349 domain-containing protein n=1 Tax=Georgenia satyanarayanai TaxID=860221 RepID=A0A2Y9APN7_9MICO|nr:DUF1349 domain-containing protein [Georgenia satyanarayanai]PYF97268.1 hypothetical protein A8987_11652 [Georgenia satyanarayanai]SSA46354.1 hypothetical protein SAMN05216184_11652 [Georgenia satyanarayanai]